MKKFQQTKKGFRARAMPYSDLDVQKEITGKLVASLQRQSNFKGTVLSRMYVGAELLEMRKQLAGTITLQWYGIPFPKEILIYEHDIKLHQYKELLLKENYLKSQLLREGLTEADIQAVIEGKYSKTEEAIKASEKKITDMEKRENISDEMEKKADVMLEETEKEHEQETEITGEEHREDNNPAG